MRKTDQFLEENDLFEDEFDSFNTDFLLDEREANHIKRRESTGCDIQRKQKRPRWEV